MYNVAIVFPLFVIIMGCFSTNGIFVSMWTICTELANVCKHLQKKALAFKTIFGGFNIMGWNS